MGYVPVDAYFDDNDNMSARRASSARRNASGKPRSAASQKTGNAARRTTVSAQQSRSKAVVASGAKAPAKRGGSKKSVSSIKESGKMLLGQVMSTKGDTKVKTVKSKEKKPIPTTAVFMAILCTALFMFMVVSYVQINEYTVEVSSLRSELNAMIEEDKELTAQLDAKNDMMQLEERAVELGMVKVDQLTKKHIALSQEDKIEVVEDEPSHDSTVVTTIMSSLIQNFNGLWEYLN